MHANPKIISGFPPRKAISFTEVSNAPKKELPNKTKETEEALLHQVTELAQTGHLNKAIELLNHPNHQPLSGNLLLTRAKFYLKNHQLAEAEAAYKEAELRYPRSHEVFYGLSKIYKQTGRDILEIEALYKAVNNCKKNNSKKAYYLELRGDYYRRGDDFAGAWFNYEESLALDPTESRRIKKEKMAALFGKV